jgi:glycosyltransferase involved in cell wall biosynthesis
VANSRPSYLQTYGLRDGEHLVCFTEGDPENLARHILNLYQHPEQRRRLGAGFQAVVEAHLGVEQVVRGYVAAIAPSGLPLAGGDGLDRI